MKIFAKNFWMNVPGWVVVSIFLSGCGGGSPAEGIKGGDTLTTLGSAGQTSSSSGTASTFTTTTGAAITTTTGTTTTTVPNSGACLPTTPVCEANTSTGGKCYYLNPVSGNDANPNGTIQAPWKSFRNIISYYQSSFKPARWIGLRGGDFVYLMSGVYSDVLTPGFDPPAGANGGVPAVFYQRNVMATASFPITIKAYPGNLAIFDPVSKGQGIYLENVSGFRFEGIEIRNAYGVGMDIFASDEVRARRMHIHDSDGVDNSNQSGFRATSSTHVELSDSIIHDNYDRLNSDTGGVKTENSLNIDFYGGGNISVHDNAIYQSQPIDAAKGGACMRYKHASTDPAARFDVFNNYFENCAMYAVSTGTANTYVHHNVINKGVGVVSKDNGGPSFLVNQNIDFNTFYVNGNSFDMSPMNDWLYPSVQPGYATLSTATGVAVKDIRFRNNIVFDTRSSFSNEQATMVINPYIDDRLYDMAAAALTWTNNCYFAGTSAPTFSFGAVNGGTRGVKGSVSTLLQWQALGYDAGSVIANPLFANVAGNDLNLASASVCVGKGAFTQGYAPKKRVELSACGP